MNIYKKTKIMLTLSFSCFTFVSANAAVSVSQQANSNNVSVSVDWSNAGNQGQYRICYTTGSTPCIGSNSNTINSTNKPSILMLSACTEYRLKVKILRRLWKLTSWDSQGVVQFKTLPTTGSTCPPQTTTPQPPSVSYNATANTISINVGSQTPLTKMRFCLRARSASNPILHPELCEREDWNEVINGYDVIIPGQSQPGHNEGYEEQSPRIAQAQRLLSPNAVFNNIMFDNLHSKCNYSLKTLLYIGNDIVHTDQSIIKTGSNGGLFGGWSCFFGSAGNAWFGLAPLDQQSVSTLLKNNDEAKLTFAFLASNDAALNLTHKYMGSVENLYANNPELEAEHAEIAQKLGLTTEGSTIRNADESTLHQRNFFLAEALVNPAFFEFWQTSLRQHDLSFSQFLNSLKSDQISDHIKTVLKDPSWEEIRVTKASKEAR